MRVSEIDSTNLGLGGGADVRKSFPEEVVTDLRAGK